MTNEEFERTYYPKYDSVIRAIARKLAKKNDTLMDDLYQEGIIALWRCNPKSARDNEDAFIRQAVKFRMIDYMRRERPALFDSLNLHLEYGGQVVLDAVTREPQLVKTKPTRRLWDDDDSRTYRLEQAQEPVDGAEPVDEAAA